MACLGEGVWGLWFRVVGASGSGCGGGGFHFPFSVGLESGVLGLGFRVAGGVSGAGFGS